MFKICLFLSALVISISQPCLHEGRLIGVTGIDLHLEEIAQDVTYYNPEHESYTFIISIEGMSQIWTVYKL